MSEDSGRNDMILRRLEMLLSRRAINLGITVYKGGYVKIQDLLDNAPIFQRFTQTVDQLKTLATSEAAGGKFTVEREYIKVNSGQSFDPNDARFPDLPAAPPA